MLISMPQQLSVGLRTGFGVSQASPDRRSCARRMQKTDVSAETASMLAETPVSLIQGQQTALAAGGAEEPSVRNKKSSGSVCVQVVCSVEEAFSPRL